MTLRDFKIKFETNEIALWSVFTRNFFRTFFKLKNLGRMTPWLPRPLKNIIFGTSKGLKRELKKHFQTNFTSFAQKAVITH